MDCSQPGSPVHVILQAGILQWIARPSSWESSWPRDPPDPEIKTAPLESPALADRFFNTGATWEPRGTFTFVIASSPPGPQFLHLWNGDKHICLSEQISIVKIMTNEIQSPWEDTKHDFKIYTILNLQLMFLKLLNSYSPGLLSSKSNWQLLFQCSF